MMATDSYYSLLGVAADASPEQVKSAFRAQALLHHPDKHANSPESNARFVLLNNAYRTLSDPDKRREYDAYLLVSSVFEHGKKSGPRLLPEPEPAESQNLLSQLNYLLWDIEDLVIARSRWGRDTIRQEKIMRRYILAILTFMDKWVLTAAGFPDYFMDARKMKPLDPLDYNKTLGLAEQGHLPFVSISDYFYNIRKRMDKFLARVNTRELLRPVPGCEASLLDCILEVQNHTIHYLSYLNLAQAGRVEEIPPFQYSRDCFRGESQ